MLQTIVLSFALLFSGGDNTETTYTIQNDESTIEWVGKKVTGQHNGVVAFKEGSFDFKKGKLTGGSFVVDMTTLGATDLDGEWKDKLDGHLKSDDFFGVEKFPTASFTIKSATSTGEGNYEVVGDITIKGHTEEITFPVTLEENDGTVKGTANIVVDRTKFNIKYGSGSFFDDLGDKTIYDDFELTVKFVATK